jgi:hypothetical protein
VKRKLMMTAMLPALVVAVLSWPGNAGPSSHAGEQGAVSDGDIVDALKSMGLRPTGQPVRRGDHYVLHAIDPSGAELRVVGDATFGDILSIAPARPVSIYASAPTYGAGPRIIHVPQPDDRASLGSDDDIEANVEPEQIAPPPRKRVTTSRRPFARSPASTPRRRTALAPALPPKTTPQRSVQNAPPPLAEGPTPIKPTPRWRNSIDTTGQIPPQAQIPPVAQMPAQAAAPSAIPDAPPAAEAAPAPTVLPEDPPAAD